MRNWVELNGARLIGATAFEFARFRRRCFSLLLVAGPPPPACPEPTGPDDKSPGAERRFRDLLLPAWLTWTSL